MDKVRLTKRLSVASLAAAALSAVVYRQLHQGDLDPKLVGPVNQLARLVGETDKRPHRSQEVADAHEMLNAVDPAGVDRIDGRSWREWLSQHLYDLAEKDVPLGVLPMVEARLEALYHQALRRDR